MFDESKKNHKKFLKIMSALLFSDQSGSFCRIKEQNLKLTMELANPILFVLQLIITINIQDH